MNIPGDGEGQEAWVGQSRGCKRSGQQQQLGSQMTGSPRAQSSAHDSQDSSRLCQASCKMHMCAGECVCGACVCVLLACFVLEAGTGMRWSFQWVGMAHASDLHHSYSVVGAHESEGYFERRRRKKRKN